MAGNWHSDSSSQAVDPRESVGESNWVRPHFRILSISLNHRSSSRSNIRERQRRQRPEGHHLHHFSTRNYYHDLSAHCETTSVLSVFTFIAAYHLRTAILIKDAPSFANDEKRKKEVAAPAASAAPAAIATAGQRNSRSDQKGAPQERWNRAAKKASSLTVSLANSAIARWPTVSPAMHPLSLRWYMRYGRYERRQRRHGSEANDDTDQIGSDWLWLAIGVMRP